MVIADTMIWRKERGLSQRPEAVLVYSPEPVILTKLKEVLHLRHLGHSEPLVNGLFFAAESNVLSLVIRQWRESLSDEEYKEVRGVLVESPILSAAELARAPMHLRELDNVLGQIDTRWLVTLLASDSLYVVFQPLVCMATGKRIACECLVRGKHQGAIVGAESLLFSAQILGICHELDHAAWRAALRQGQSLMHSGLALFLNFTPSSISTPQFAIQKTKTMCREMEVDIAQLVFEVTEAEKVHDLNFLRSIMQEYQAAGAKIALDDLGSGYSSILHLSDLRRDWVKLDQRLVHGAYGDRTRIVLLKAITEAAHKLNVRVVAEGIETEEDLRFCIEIGADVGQGYFVARPEEVSLDVSADARSVLEKLRQHEAHNQGPEIPPERSQMLPALLKWLRAPTAVSPRRTEKQKSN